MTALSPLLVCLLLSAVSGIAASSYTGILTQPGMVLAFWARWLYRLKDWYCKSERLKLLTPDYVWSFSQSEQRLLEKEFYVLKHREERADYILKPILTCVYCVGGQMGLWLSVYYFHCYGSGVSIILTALTAVLSVWMGGLFQYIQHRYFPL